MNNLFKGWHCNVKTRRYGIHIFAFQDCIPRLKWRFLVIVMFAFFFFFLVKLS